MALGPGARVEPCGVGALGANGRLTRGGEGGVHLRVSERAREIVGRLAVQLALSIDERVGAAGLLAEENVARGEGELRGGAGQRRVIAVLDFDAPVTRGLRAEIARDRSGI